MPCLLENSQRVPLFSFKYQAPCIEVEPDIPGFSSTLTARGPPFLAAEDWRGASTLTASLLPFLSSSFLLPSPATALLPSSFLLPSCPPKLVAIKHDRPARRPKGRTRRQR